MDGLRPYPEYKDSDVAWLGQVPRHWELRRLRTVAEMRVSSVDKHTNDGELKVQLCNYVDVYKNERITEQVRFMRASATAEEVARFRLELGDVLITKDSESWIDIGVPALVEHAMPDLVCGYHLALLRPYRSLMDSGYLLRAIQSPAIAFQFHVEANGVTRYGLSHSAIKSIWLPLPPIAEQSAITRFIDHADRIIRRFIRNKQQLIATLNAQKQAIIQQAVTRGLDPNVGLKPSGVAWLGDVPEHWDCVPIKRLLSRMDYGTSEQTSPDGSIRILTMANIQKGEVIVPKSGGLNQLPADLLLQHQDLLFTRTNGNPDLVGKVGIFRGQLEDQISFASYLVRLRVRDEHNPQWLHMLLNSSAFWPFARSFALVNLQTNLNASRYGQFQVPVPPLQEQIAIVEWVTKQIHSIEYLLIQTRDEITLMRDYRTRLIADVVTGKLDVRAVATALPIEETAQHAAEPELPDSLDMQDSEDSTEADVDADLIPAEGEADAE